MGFGPSSGPSTILPLHSSQTHSLLFSRDTLPRFDPPHRLRMEIPPIPPGNQALAAAISRANTPPALRNPPPPPPRQSRLPLWPFGRKSSQKPETASN